MKAYMMGITKEEFVNEMKEHRRLDNFMKGTYSMGTKACATGCGIKSINKLTDNDLNTDEHLHYEKYLGVPEWLARVEDVIFEGVSEIRSKTWPVEFSEAINTGSNLNNTKNSFVLFILKQNIKIQRENLNSTKDKEIKHIIEQVIGVNNLMIDALQNGDQNKIAAAGSAAWSAAWSAWSAARSAESAAWSAWSAAWSAARSAARSAEWSAARSAARSAEWSAESAAWSARSAAYEKYADELLRLIRKCK